MSRPVVPWIVCCAAAAFGLGWALSPGNAQEKNSEPVQVRSARTQLRLAEITLMKAQRMNQRVGGAVVAETVAEYREDVEVAKAQLAAAQAGGGENQFATWLRSAQAALHAAQNRWQSAVAANQGMPGTFDELEIERLRLRAELARLRLQRGQTLANQPRIEQLQWQVNLLRDEVQHLSEQVARRPPSGPVFPMWWFW
jgi:hypothetical protein